ncbi:MAG TPA: pyridoxamine 5'-phosphate oxidase family protein, partial [Syntrophomonadaceae bacterium]|nr:pyridoxamine 5'-phosphate oxidase family protein [Syntrophomonadaceae bacterium]
MEATIWTEVLSILNDPAAIGYLATVDDGKPRVRPFGFMFEDNGRLYFCTSSTKDVYNQITTVPFIEYSKTRKDFVWVRVSGEIRFDDDIKRKERILEQIPELTMVFQTADNPTFKVFYLEHGNAILDDFTQPRRSCEF